jgi:putative serine protease PepD
MVAGKVLASVVTISVTTNGATTTGSGEVIRADGYVLTNDHVIASAVPGSTVTLLFSNGASLPAAVVGRDTLTDVAVLRATTTTPLTPITYGASAPVQIGEPVVAAGAPLGLPNTVTAGIVSALGRTVSLPAGNGQATVLLAAIQTDAAINPGNSGGALVNCNGELIGVNSAIATAPAADGTTASGGSIGLGFAIPVDLARAVADELIATGTVNHSYLGLDVTEIPPPSPGVGATPAGLRVIAVSPGGPAALAGMLAGDIITSIDGQPNATATQLALVTLTHKPGQTVTLGYTRGTTPAQATLTLTAPPP